MDFQIDNLTVILLLVLVVLAIYYRFFSEASPLVHPLLLGKQSEVSAVRKPGETGVYRSFATGQGTPLTVRPANRLKTVSDIVPNSNGSSLALPRSILDVSLTDEALSEMLRLLPIGLKTLFPTLTASTTSPTPILTLLPPSPSTSLPLLLLQLSVPPSTPLVILPSPVLLSSALSSTAHPQPAVVVVHASLVDDVLEQVWEDRGDKAGVLVVGDPQKEQYRVVENAKTRGMKVAWWEEIWEVAEKAPTEKGVLPDAHIYDAHSYFYSSPSPESEPAVVKVNHLNITAGIAAVLSLFPADKRPSSALRDVVASAVPLNTPFGMTIALASVWSGAGLRMIGQPTASWSSSNTEENQAAELEVLAEGDKPTLLFITSKHHSALVSRLHESFSSHSFGAFAARHKLPSLRSGHVSRNGLWDKYVWSGIRESAFGGVAGEKLRGVIVVGDAPAAESLGLSHLLLSLPLTRLHPSPFSTGPIFVTNFYDLQSSLPNLTLDFSPDKAHCGPPASNVEVVLRSADGEGEEGGQGPWKGRIFVRGPGVLERLDGAKGSDGWVDIGEDASVQTNGTFIVRGLS